MVKKILLGFGSLALTIASAASGYSVRFYDPVTINGAKLEPGEYRVEVNGGMAVIKKGKTVAEAPVKVETSDAKYPTNGMRIEAGRIAEIRIGGTRTKLVFEGAGGDATK